jgi:hypothetical protein
LASCAGIFVLPAAIPNTAIDRIFFGPLSIEGLDRISFREVEEQIVPVTSPHKLGSSSLFHWFALQMPPLETPSYSQGKPASARTPVRAYPRSVLAWQVDYVVGEVQRDFIQREIGVLDLFGEHDVAIAVVVRKRSGSVGTYG